MTKSLPAPKGPTTIIILSSEARAKYQARYPAHTCVDRPEVPCEACEKWSPKKTKRVSNRQRA
jgi:hypothetical protein